MDGISSSHAASLFILFFSLCQLQNSLNIWGSFSQQNLKISLLSRSKGLTVLKAVISHTEYNEILMNSLEFSFHTRKFTLDQSLCF